MTSLKLLLLAVVFVATGGAVFTEFFRRNRLLASTAAIVAIVGSYYLGVSVYKDLVTDVSETALDSNIGGVYTQYVPERLDLYDQWGEFHINGNCDLKYRQSVVARFEYVSGTARGTCAYYPKFSTSPSGDSVIVFIATNDYGYSRFSLVDIRSKQVRFNEHGFGKGAQGFDNLVSPTDTWSKEEDKLLIKRQVVLKEYAPSEYGETSIASGFHPCVLNLENGGLVCENEATYIESVIREAESQSQENLCIRDKTCFLVFDVVSGRTDPNGSIKALIRYETSEYAYRQADQPIIFESQFEVFLD